MADAMTSLATMLAHDESVWLRADIFGMSGLLTRVAESHLYLGNIELSRFVQSSGRTRCWRFILTLALKWLVVEGGSWGSIMLEDDNTREEDFILSRSTDVVQHKMLDSCVHCDCSK